MGSGLLETWNPGGFPVPRSPGTQGFLVLGTWALESLEPEIQAGSPFPGTRNPGGFPFVGTRTRT